MTCVGIIGHPFLGLADLSRDNKLDSFPGKVIHIRDEAATSYRFTEDWCGNHVNQERVNQMTKKGLLELTGASDVPSAWKTLIPNYSPGKKFAIKVNFNNYHGRMGQDVNALIEPVNAIIGTLMEFGAAASNIIVYDVTNGHHKGMMPKAEFMDRCLHPGVRFAAYTDNAFSATEKVKFSVSDIQDRPIANALVESDYLINMPYVKYHITNFVTLAFKNHYGSVDRCDLCHVHSPITAPPGSPYSPLVDLYKNRHFRDKTVLTIGDFLFGVWQGAPRAFPPRYEARPWKTFGNKAPNSLLFATDPVAIDSLMADFIDSERQAQGLGSLDPRAWDYLRVAESAGLGVFEHGDPWKQPFGSGYKKITYRYLNRRV
jgi:hypothetical protein